MRVLQLTLNKSGGIVHYTSQLSNALSKKAEVCLMAPSGVEAYLFDREVKLIELNYENSKKGLLVNTILFYRVISVLKKIYAIDPDVIHLQTFHPWTCLFFPFLGKYRIITTIHDVSPHPGSKVFVEKAARDAHIRYSDALIVHGIDARKKMEKIAPNKEIFVIPQGAYSFFNELGKSALKEEPATILFFGRIFEYKGISYLLRAVPEISRQVPNLKVVIAGSGTFDERSSVENSPFFELHNRFIENDEVASFFQRASVVVLPYVECTQTGVVPIAYAFKKPVVVTNVGCIPEIVDDGRTGFIVPPRDPSALACALIRILKDAPLRKHMGENAYLKMKEDLSWDSIAEETILAYRSVLGRS